MLPVARQLAVVESRSSEHFRDKSVTLDLLPRLSCFKDKLEDNCEGGEAGAAASRLLRLSRRYFPWFANARSGPVGGWELAQATFGQILGTTVATLGAEI